MILRRGGVKVNEGAYQQVGHVTDLRGGWKRKPDCDEECGEQQFPD
jgi:hypothetical protein